MYFFSTSPLKKHELAIDLKVMKNELKEEFVSEPIMPVENTMDTSRMVIGEPGLPQEFIWRKKKYKIKEVLETWKETGPCTHGSGEQYVRKHWYKIRTTEGNEMKIYFMRKPASKAKSKLRWWLYTIYFVA